MQSNWGMSMCSFGLNQDMIRIFELKISAYIVFVSLIGCTSLMGVKSGHASHLGDWQLIKTKDSYTGNWMNDTKSLTFSFKEDGTFKQADVSNSNCNGRYEKTDSLFSVSHSCNTAKLNYKMESVSTDSLLLSLKGRHGKVYYQFARK